MEKAIKDGNVAEATRLLDEGEDPNKQYSIGNTALILASYYGHTEIVNLLLDKGADPNKQSTVRNTALIIASYYGHTEIVNLLLDKGADPNKQDNRENTALVLAVGNNKLENTKLLLEKGADPNIRNIDGDSALSLSVSKNNSAIVKELLLKGANPNIRDNRTSTPIFYTLTHESPEMLKLLLENGADPNIQNADLVTPLILATLKSKIDFIKLLLEHRADANIKDKFGKNAIYYAKTGEIRDLLTDKKPEPPVPYSGKSKSDIEYFDIFLDKVDESTTEAKMKNMIKNTSFCPVCLGNIFRKDGCLYMKHICENKLRHAELYNKYKNSTGQICWCTDCGRIADSHVHYKIGLANADKPELEKAGDPFAKTCISNGGGSTTEKLKRVARMIDYTFELQHFVGEISEQEARTELIEEVWNAATMRMRFDPIKFKRWKTDLSVFEKPTDLAPAPEAIPLAGDIENPVVHDEPDVKSSLLDDPPIIEFKHKNKDGVMFNHMYGDDDLRFIGKSSLITYMNTMGEKLGKCFDDDCGGWLWPQEIEMAFNDAKLKDSVTDDDRALLKSYKERFNAAKAPKTGGAKWKFNLFSDIENGECYLPPKKKAGNRTRKNKKRAKKTRRA